MELVVTVLTTIITFVVGLTVLVKNRLSGTHVYLGVLILFLSLYPAANYLALHATTQTSLDFWTKLVMISAIPVGPLFFSFVSVFPRHTFVYSKKMLYFFAIWISINVILNFSGLLFSEVALTDGKLALSPGIGIASFSLMQIGSIIGGIWILRKKYLLSKNLARRQLFLISFGFTVSFVLMLTSTIILPIVFGYSGLVALSPLFLALGAGMVATAVARHQFLDIKPATARSVSFIILIIIFGLVYALSWTLITSLLLGQEVVTSFVISSTLMTLFVSLTFQPILGRLRIITDRFFFAGYYDRDVLLYDLSVVMASTLLLEDLSRMVLEKLNNSLRSSRSAIILLNKERIVAVYSQGFQTTPHFDEKEMNTIIKENELISVDDIPPSERRKHLIDSGISVLVPLVRDDKFIGAVILGEKKSGDRYYDTDFGILKIFASQAVIAIENANAYEEIRRFNITLKEEVDRATNKLSSANRRLLELDKLKDEFVSMASHELRTPMVSIRNYVWMVLNGKGGKVNPKQREYLRRAYDSTSRLSRMVNSMLNLSRIESGRVILSVQQADIRKVIKDVIAEIGMRADKAGIKLTLRQKVESEKSGEAVQLPSVLIDIDKIKEVLINLIGNSLKFTPAGGSITGTLTVGKQFVKVGITDTGVGLNDEQIPKLFQKFSMLRESYSSNATMAQGTGLGLYISKSIIELHGGKIWIESEGSGKGSTFFFTIPRYSEERLHLLTKNQHNGKDAGIIHSAVTDY